MYVIIMPIINNNQEIIKELLKSDVQTPLNLASFKRRAAKKHKIACPSNIEMLSAYHNLIKSKSIKPVKKIKNLLITRPVRSLSGIVNISALTKPYPCPGHCLFCPQEKNIPKSYLSGEPAVERAKKLNYDPYLQVKKRLEMLEDEGHPTDKIEMRLIGGTWSYYSKQYQTWFIKECFRACNFYQAKVAGPDQADLSRQKSTISSQHQNLLEAQKLNEQAKHRIIGLSVETRPDFINTGEIKRLRVLGITMVELGVQSIYNDVLKLNRRGHQVKATILATKLLKEAGFKVCYQMMPNLLGSIPARDLEMFRQLFSGPDFQPDYLKIYPCALLKSASLHLKWQSGQYQPYTEKQLINLIKSIKKIIPGYVRIQRIARDIPSANIIAGPAKISNLRQLIADKMKNENWSCRCIRCREVGARYDRREKLYLYRWDYQASGGWEIFLSFADYEQKKLYSLLRLRIPSSGHQPIFPILKHSALIREMHTYGRQLPIAEKSTFDFSPQHRGLGKKLLAAAEKIAKGEFGLNTIAVIAGIGARGYYRKLGFKLQETYMVKRI